MAIDLTQAYPQQVDAATAAYPLGKARNVTSIDDNNATPLDENWMNDHFGFQQALLARAGIVPSGTPDTATASQYLDAVEFMVASGAQSYVVDAATGIPSSNIPDSEASVVSRSFDNMGVGGATYRRSSAAAVEGYPALSWFQSADGAYWLLDEKHPTPEMFGAIPAENMGDLTHNGASDSTEAIRQARQYALLKKRPLYIYGYFMWVGSLTLETNERIIGKGRHNCGLQVKTDGALYEGGFQIINDNAFVVGLELQAYLYTPKSPNGGTGMVGVSLLIGNYSDGTIPVPKNYCLDDILLTRKNNETDHVSYTGIGMQISGGANTGKLGLIEIATRHSVAYMSHWNGDANTPETPSTETVHPRNFTIDKLIVSDHVDTLMTLSSVANLDIRSVYAKSCATVLTVLAGDEADDLNIGEPNIGTGVHFGEIIVNNVTAKGKPFDEAMGITSLATSKFQTMFGQPRQQQLRIGITIDNLTLHTNDPAIIYGIDLFYYYGLFRVKSARLTGFKHPFRASKSRGDININFEMTDGACIVKDSDATLTGNFRLKDRFVTPYVNPWAVLVDSATFEIPIYGFLRGATVLTLPNPLPERIERGGVVEITGTINGKVQTVRYVSEKFVPRDATTVDLGIVFQNNCNSATLKYITKCDVDVNAEAMTGCHVGVYAKAGNVKVRGNLTAGRYNVHAYGADTVVDYKMQSSVSGDYRMEGLTTSLYDLFLEAGAAAIASGELGKGKLADTGAWRSIGGEASGARHKLIIKDAIIYDKTKVVAVEAHNIDCAVSGCMTSTGKDYNIIDVYGLEKVGSNTNGHFERNENGVMECWARNVQIGETQPYTWTFPQGFAVTGSIYVDAISTSSSSSRVPSALATSGTQAAITLTENAEGTNGTPSPATAGMNLYAKGFWKVPA